MSASKFTRTKNVAVNKTLPITTGKSSFFKRINSYFANAFPSENIFYKKSSASNSANQPVIAVITGFNAFRKAVFKYHSFFTETFCISGADIVHT
jgi:hypothetical protein